MAHYGQISDILKQIFKFSGHNQQIQLIQSYSSGKDCILCAPTAFGKSVAYQAGHHVLKVLGRPNNQVVVITPLLSLIADSVSKTNSLGDSFTAVSLSDVSTTPSQLTLATHIFTTPESIFEGRWSCEMVRNPVVMARIGLVVIDECHVISC